MTDGRRLFAGMALALAVLQGGSGCADFEVVRCGATVCLPEQACCGDRCVLATCGDGQVDDGEACDGLAGEACVDRAFDYGQVRCSGACETDLSSCVSFGLESAQVPCSVASPVDVATLGSSLWVASRGREVVRVTRDACTAIPLPTVPQKVLAVREDEAIVALVQPQGQTSMLLRAVTLDGAVEIPVQPNLGAFSSGAVLDSNTVAIAAGRSNLLMVTRGAPGWAARRIRIHCAQSSMVDRPLDVAPLGDNLLVTFAGVNLVPPAVDVPTQFALIPRASLATATTLTPTCADLASAPPTFNPIAVAANANKAYLVSGPFIFSIDVNGAQAVELPLTLQRSVPGLNTLGGAWFDIAGDLNVGGGLDVMMLRNGRWRRSDRPERHAYGPTSVFGGRAVTASTAGLLSSQGFGYEQVDELGALRPVFCTSNNRCTIAGAGRARGADWIFLEVIATVALPHENAILRDGQERILPVGEPVRMDVAPDREVIIGQSGQALTLYNTIDDPAPVLLVDGGGCGAAAVDLDVGASGIVAATRKGTGTAACPFEDRVLLQPGTTPPWTTTERVSAVASAGPGVALVSVADFDANREVIRVRILELRGDTAVERAAIDGNLVVRDMWAEDANHAWLVGEQGLLLRFDTDRVEDVSTTSNQIVRLNTIEGTGPSDVFITGNDSTVLHYDGVAWTPLTPPAESAIINTLQVRTDEVYIATPREVIALRVPRVPISALVCE